MSDDLYQQALVALARDASHVGALVPSDATVTRDNPLCGDRVTMTARFNPDGSLSEIRHKTRGCLLCEAGAALAASSGEGMDAAKVQQARAALRAWLRGEVESAPFSGADAFVPVKPRKSRHDCVTLGFDALVGLFETHS